MIESSLPDPGIGMLGNELRRTSARAISQLEVVAPNYGGNHPDAPKLSAFYNSCVSALALIGGGGVVVTPAAPTITVGASHTVQENNPFSLTLTANQVVTWAKTGGTDQASFGLAGAVLSLTAKDFEAPADSNTDNVYAVQVTATNGTGQTAVATISVTVTDISEAVGPGAAPSAPTLLPDVHYHPNSQSATLDGSARVLACPDLRGLAALSGVAYGTGSPIGPTQLTDAAGNKFWRFYGPDAAFIGNALAAMSARALGVFYAGRMHKQKATVNFFTPRYTAYTDDTTNTSAGTAQTTLQARVVSSGAPSFNQIAGTDTVNGFKMVPPCNLHVGGAVTRTTALGGQRYYMNLDTAVNATQATATTVNMIGGVIGGVPAASNGIVVPTVGNGNWFDLYEFLLYNRSLTDAEADNIAASMVANWAIPALTSQLILDGDSITDTIPTTLAVNPTSADNPGMMLTQPGAMLVAASCRVLNFGTSGNTVANLVTKKNAAQGVFGLAKYPGGPANNRVAFQIGRNDLGTVTSAAHYAAVVALVNNATPGSEGYLQRGLSVAVVGNISTGNPGIQTKIEEYRGLIMTGAGVPLAQFATDVLANTGQTYDGLLSAVPLHLITVGGDTKFMTQADANDSASGYMDGDATHPRVAGAQLMVSGGDTPQYGLNTLA